MDRPLGILSPSEIERRTCDRRATVPGVTDDEIEAALAEALPDDACELCSVRGVGHGCGACKTGRVCTRCWIGGDCCASKGVTRWS